MGGGSGRSIAGVGGGAYEEWEGEEHSSRGGGHEEWEV